MRQGLLKHEALRRVKMGWMRKGIAAVLMSYGCVHSLPLSPYEQCATQGMVLAGVSMSSASGTGVAYNVNSGVTVVGASGGSFSTQCRRPATPADRCEAQAALASGRVKLDYWPTPRNFVIGVGYILILPGLVASVAFIGGEHAREQEAIDAARAELIACHGSAQDENAADGQPERAGSWCTDVVSIAGDSSSACFAGWQTCHDFALAPRPEGVHVADCKLQRDPVACYETSGGPACVRTMEECNAARDNIIRGGGAPPSACHQ